MFLGQHANDGNLSARKFSDMKWLNIELSSESYERDEKIQAILKEKSSISMKNVEGYFAYKNEGHLILET